MKIGLVGAAAGAAQDPEAATELMVAAEAAGFDTVWVAQHVVLPIERSSRYPYTPDGSIGIPDDAAIPDPLVWMAFAAAKTSSIRLAAGVLILPQLNPLVLAKQAATLDRLSNGRLVLGVGVGWLREEFDALGVPWAARGRRTDEYIAILRKAWALGPTAHDGEFMAFAPLMVHPKPARESGIPIVIGGHSEAAARRAGRLGDGFHPQGVRGAELRPLLQIMREAADGAGVVTRRTSR